MNYVNPFALLEAMNNGPVDPGNTAALSLLRKKMLAEIELTEDKVLRIATTAFSKNDLLQFFDRLSSTGELAFHASIAADPVLLRFLETGEITGHFVDNPVYQTPAFLTFISPWYEPVFTNAVLDSLKHKWLENTTLLFANPLLLDGEYTTTSYTRIFRYCRVLEEQLKISTAKIREGAAFNKKELSAFASGVLVAQLNQLPSEFHEWRSDYGISMINLALATYRKDFAFGMSVIQLIEKLTTTRYVQNENHKRKEILQAHRREQHRNRSLIQHILWYPGHWIKPIRPRWLSEEGAGGIMIGIVILIFYMMNNGDAKNPAPKKNTQTDHFANARTSDPMKYLLYTLKMTTGDTSQKKMNSQPRTGDDVYGPAFMESLRKSGVPYKVDSSRNKAEVRELVGPEASARLVPEHQSSAVAHRQSIHLFNRLEVPAIAMIQTPDTFYSCYIVPGDSAYLPLQITANQLYVYIGQHWDAGKEATSSMAGYGAYRAKGFFALPYKDSEKFMKESSLIFTLDPVYWASSDRNIPIEIGLGDNTNLYFNLLENNAAGVELETGD
ncbi:hypothetical protein [Chitinophaga arvensicola]|uniref:Uncharacterized protein n=1 Tax=Chitinophaga arvensicola TaxID=29529 RepID=A0A1I0SBM8_9BACT|nr:hypothetical protein [Chitinophaga arvensicola]SEW54014.1 hypothetical protein SAMN04488122_5849 [Chitinophaga arvensicola]